MEKTFRMTIINKEGKRIEELVPKNLLSIYEGMGWKKVEKTVEKTTFTKIKEEKKFSDKN